jgi:hypothetical protein
MGLSKAYILRGYFRYGIDGVIRSHIYAFSRLIRVAKARERFQQERYAAAYPGSADSRIRINFEPAEAPFVASKQSLAAHRGSGARRISDIGADLRDEWGRWGRSENGAGDARENRAL